MYLRAFSTASWAQSSASASLRKSQKCRVHATLVRLNQFVEGFVLTILNAVEQLQFNRVVIWNVPVDPPLRPCVFTTPV